MSARTVDLGAARGVLIRHHRRADTDRCARCGAPWSTRAAPGEPLAGCAARRYVGMILLATGQLNPPAGPPRRSR